MVIGDPEGSDPLLRRLERMIGIDSRSHVSNIAIADFMAGELENWQIEKIDYTDAAGTPKRNLVALDPRSVSRLGFAGHLDTVSDAGWEHPPFVARIEGHRLSGLGASDMKGPIAAFVQAALELEPALRPMIILTADEEVGKQGVRETLGRSTLLNSRPPRCFVVAEPTANGVVRGHRADIQFLVCAKGIQAHSSTGRGENANIALIPFLADVRLLHLRLRSDVSLHDPQYDPPFCDLNFVIDNHGTLPNTTVGLATCWIKFRYSRAIDPQPIVDAITQSAKRHGLELEIRREASPPELSPNDPIVVKAEQILGVTATVAGLGTEASYYSRCAPTIVFGPGDIAHAHKPSEYIDIEQLKMSVSSYRRLAQELS